MEKRIYQTPSTDILYINVMSHLLDWSAWEDTGQDGEEAESKKVFYDDFDPLEDEDIEPVWSFNVWED